MIDKNELKRLAEAFPDDLDWDSNTEQFFNGPSGESLGGGPTGYYCVYGAPFEIDGEQYDGHTYVEICKADFAKFMVAAREGVLTLLTEIDQLKAENEALRKDADRYRWLRDGAGYCDTRDIPGMAPARMDEFIDSAKSKGDKA